MPRAEGSTARLLQLCGGYYVFYVITGVTVKYFLGKPDKGFPGMQGLEFLVYSTLGGTFICLAVVLALRWYRLESDNPTKFGPLSFPSEFLYIIPSGVCTAVIIPTTTLMYTLPISVMVAMVIMRAAVIVVSRGVDALQIRQGILTKKVYATENIAVAFALAAVSAKVLWTPSILAKVGLAEAAAGASSFEFLRSPAAMAILSSYITAYAIRIYIMNYYKNTRGKGRKKQNNKAFFAVEQIAASLSLALGAAAVFLIGSGADLEQVQVYREAITQPQPLWVWATLAGTAFGAAAFFSVFIFMYKGRTATFVGLVNRLTSLVAGTTATLFFAFAFGGRWPAVPDWIALGLILVAVGFLAHAERRRARELGDAPAAPAPPAEAPDAEPQTV